MVGVLLVCIGCLVDVWSVSGGCLEGVESYLEDARWVLEVVWKVSECCKRIFSRILRVTMEG